MSKGSQVVPVRFPEELLDEMRWVIAEINNRGLDPQYDVSNFVRKAVQEKLAKRERGKYAHRKRPGGRAEMSS